MRLIDVDILGRPAFSVVVGADSLYRYDGINTALTAESGFTKSSFVGKTPEDCMLADSARFSVTQYRRCFLSGEMQEYEELLDVPAGHKWWRTTLSPVIDASGTVVQILGLCVDITERKAAKSELRSAAFQDPLTGIGNRRTFESNLRNAVAQAASSGSPFAVILADVDHFKSINDRHGHAAGDDVLCAVAVRLEVVLSKAGRPARIGGDEFAMILPDVQDWQVVAMMADLRRDLSDPIRIGDVAIPVGTSLGFALWRPMMTGAEVMAAADAAMYEAKRLRSSELVRHELSV